MNALKLKIKTSKDKEVATSIKQKRKKENKKKDNSVSFIWFIDPLILLNITKPTIGSLKVIDD